MKITYFVTLFFSLALFADNEWDSKITPIIEEAKVIAADSVIVQAVVDSNIKTPSEYQSLTNEKWKKLSPVDPLIKNLKQNNAAKKLKSLIKNYISEAFISNKNGKKVAFLEKTTSWDHSGKPKHNLPMQGKTWRGEMELDESTGTNQIQISVPILKENVPIGSLVLGIAVAKL